MKYIIFLFLLFLNIDACIAQELTVEVKYVDTQKKNAISYKPGIKLQWTDFLGNPDEASSAAAITTSGFSFKMNYSYSSSKASLVILIDCYFSKNDSWGKDGKKTAYILEHEQHHFDITYLHALQFIRNLQQEKFTRGNYSTLIQKHYTACEKAMSKMQNDYDMETYNSQISSKQERWNEKISGLLAKME